jgi:hypothetical protein
MIDVNIAIFQENRQHRSGLSRSAFYWQHFKPPAEVAQVEEFSAEI